MKKLTILVLTLLISYSSYGEWVKIIKDNEGDTYYINPDRINRFKDSITAIILRDYPKPKTHGVRSVVFSVRGDCNTYKYREESVSYHQSSMGKGGSLYKTTLTTSLKDIPKGSIGGIILDYACNFDKKGKNQNLKSYSNSNSANKVGPNKQKKDKTTSNNTISDYKKDLEAIKDLFESGLITKEDYDKQKQKILDRM